MSCRVSVALASYNGAKYIKEQIESILYMMNENDQLVVSDDGSSDGTIEIVKEYAKRDGRIVLVNNGALHGIQSNFNNALRYCEGKYIFYSDQDDVWINNKINKVVDVFEKTNADLIIHNGYHVDECLNVIDAHMDIFHQSSISKNPVRNFIKGTYWGCCMAISRNLLPLVLPFPVHNSVGHDLWTGVVTGFCRKRIELVNDILIYHRLHKNNATPKKPTSLCFRLQNRYVFFKELCKRYRSANEKI